MSELVTIVDAGPASLGQHGRVDWQEAVDTARRFFAHQVDLYTAGLAALDAGEVTVVQQRGTYAASGRRVIERPTSASGGAA